jgi:hypothetical protein
MFKDGRFVGRERTRTEFDHSQDEDPVAVIDAEKLAKLQTINATIERAFREDAKVKRQS